MLAAWVIITIITILANAWATAADLTQPKWLLANMDEVSVPRSWLVPLAALKGAGTAGLLLGLLGLRPLGIAAAIGLVLFFTGALAAHVRARALHNIESEVHALGRCRGCCSWIMFDRSRCMETMLKVSSPLGLPVNRSGRSGGWDAGA